MSATGYGHKNAKKKCPPQDYVRKTTQKEMAKRNIRPKICPQKRKIIYVRKKTRCPPQDNDRKKRKN